MEAPIRPMESWYEAQAPERATELIRDLTETLRDLLDLGADFSTRSAEDDVPGSWDAAGDALADAVGDRLASTSYVYGGAETEDLIGALTRPKAGESPLRSLVDDTAEILALPREGRTEYVSNRLTSPPWAIQKLLLEYAILARTIDDLVGALSKGYCAESCDRLPVGCCATLGYDMGVVPTAMLSAQAVEVRWQASGGRDWAPLEPGAIEQKCRYHTETGCTMARFKSPACIGFLCTALVAHLESRFRPAPLRRFLEVLAIFQNHYLDRRLIFSFMADVIDSGRVLLR